MSSSSSTSPSKAEPSVSDIIHMTAGETSTWCLKLGLEAGTTTKTRQIALIQHVTAARDNADFTVSKTALPFSEETFEFEWKFSRDELWKCDAASKGSILKSNAFTDANGCKWKLRFYPKGSSSTNPRKASLYLSLENMEQIGAVKVYTEDSLSHVESGLVRKGTTKIHAGNGQVLGYLNFMDIPDLASESQCPICLEQVFEKLSTECGHAFCAKCTVKMLTESARIKCPLCRRTVACSDELVSVRYSALESFTLKITLRTTLLEKDMGANASLGDAVAMSQSIESKFSALESKFETKLSAISDELAALRRTLSGSKRNFSEMNAE